MQIPNTLWVKFFFLKYAFKNHNDSAKKKKTNTHTPAQPQNINPSEVKTFKWCCRKEEKDVKGRTEQNMCRILIQ